MQPAEIFHLLQKCIVILFDAYQTLQLILMQIFVLPKSFKHSNLYCIFKNVDAKVKVRCPSWYYFHMDHNDAITCLSFFYLFYHYSSLKVYRERNDKDKKSMCAPVC